MQLIYQAIREGKPRLTLQEDSMVLFLDQLYSKLISSLEDLDEKDEMLAQRAEGGHYDGTLLQMRTGPDADFYLVSDPNMVLKADKLVAADTFGKAVAFSDRESANALQDNYKSLAHVIQDVYGGDKLATGAAETSEQKTKRVREGMGEKNANFTASQGCFVQGAFKTLRRGR